MFVCIGGKGKGNYLVKGVKIMKYDMCFERLVCFSCLFFFWILNGILV